MAELYIEEKTTDHHNNPQRFTESPIIMNELEVAPPPTNEGLFSPNANHFTPHTRVRLGICSMDKKARSKPMSEILSRLDDTLFEVVFFGDDLILNADVSTWPVCDVLIAFHSSGYPLGKAEKYVELRQPFVFNDLKMQWILMDRRRVYDLLEESGIDVPRHVYMSRDGFRSSGTGVGNGECGELIEHDDHIEINGVVISKPFVEKPVNADDHNIAIYYPTSAGGGCKKLFRKIGDRSSEFYPDINEVRKNGSYIYEEFVETQGTDVKMYTVGPDYGHAEARKSPTVDGKVERNPDGKEVRFPVILTLREKEIARRIVLVFKQQVCGFDLLRVQEEDSLVSYVCDVNGWSFVKNSKKYYEDCAQILTEHMLAACKPQNFRCFSAVNPLMATMEDVDNVHEPNTKHHHKPSKNRYTTLQTVSRLLSDKSPSPTALLDPPEFPQTNNQNLATTLKDGAFPVREIPDALAQEPASLCTSAASSVVDDTDFRHNVDSGSSLTESEVAVKTTHQEELRCVIAIIRHGDRTPKQKLKLNTNEKHVLDYFRDRCTSPKKDLKVKDKVPMVDFLNTVKLMIAEKKQQKAFKDVDLLYKLQHMRDVLERWKIGGLNRKLQIKPRKWEEIDPNDLPAQHDQTDKPPPSTIICTEVQLILKWGGNLTKLGERQAINLGQRLRHQMYPDAPGGGILRLHSTFRHDLKIKTSDEGRVMKTAAAFAKGLLELEGEIPPILVSLVHKEKDSLHMLDPSGNKDVKKELEACKLKVNEKLQQDLDCDSIALHDKEDIVGPACLASLHEALEKVSNPKRTLFKIHNLIGELIGQLDEMLGLMKSGDEDQIEGGEGLKGHGEEALSGIKLYKGETLLELTERWRFIYKKLYDDSKDAFDLSRIPDVHDNVRFDMLHNPHLGLTSTLKTLYSSAKLMADCVVPQEYGTTIEEKRSIGNKMCRALLEKIKYDLIIARTDNQGDMRYMINMEYSADLPINTLGRRIRTRLYFTSESHLHTILNVLRFPSSSSSTSQNVVLSTRGRELISKSPELCYLTQIIIRLFEDPKKEMDDPKRFRVEILFSPGATATPLHMDEMYRDMDTSRFDTTSLEMISKEGLTCREVEEYFDESIVQGKTDDEEDGLMSVQSTVLCDKRHKERKLYKKTMKKGSDAESGNVAISSHEVGKMASSVEQKSPKRSRSFAEGTGGGGGVVRHKKNVSLAHLESTFTGQNEVFTTELMETKEESKERTTPNETISSNNDHPDDKKQQQPPSILKSDDDRHLLLKEQSHRVFDEHAHAAENDDDFVDKEKVEKLARLLARRYLWRGLATVSFVLGVGCLFAARKIQDDLRVQRWSRK